MIDKRDERGAKRIDKFAFTGSTAVGRQIGEVAGRNLLHPTLELGGKNPLVVMADADVENAVAGALWASFGTGGQRCTSAGNIILDAPVYDEFKARFRGRHRGDQDRRPAQAPGCAVWPVHQRALLHHLGAAL